MNGWLSKLCALLLALALMPGAFELMENASHLMAEGHLAHAAASGDRHEPSGPEHGCTPTSHLCGCHASLAMLGSSSLPKIQIRAAGSSSRPKAESPLTGFRPSVDRPPQV